MVWMFGVSAFTTSFLVSGPAEKVPLKLSLLLSITLTWEGIPAFHFVICMSFFLQEWFSMTIVCTSKLDTYWDANKPGKLFTVPSHPSRL